MGYKVEPINAEEAKKEIVSFDYALIYMISEVILKRIDELEVINWEECEEARFFSKNKEIHFFREDDTLQAVKVPRVARLPRFSARPGLIRRSSDTSAWNVASLAGRRKMRKRPRKPLWKTVKIRESEFQISRYK